MGPLDPRLSLIATAAKVRPPHVFHVVHAIKELGSDFNVAAFAAFCQLDPKHIEAIIAALDANDISLGTQRKTGARGTRLPDDFTIPPEWLLAAQIKKGWTIDVAKTEAENFTNHWQAKSGKEAVKLDWKKTWLVWIGNSRKPNGDYRPEREMSREERLAQYDRNIVMARKLGRPEEVSAWEARKASIDG